MPEPVLRNGWGTHRFGDMAIMVNDRIDDPSAVDVDYYVGLEHLDSESLKIRRWGSPSDVAATKLRFRAGDIIFGRRRVYQRKLAVADFDGICSAHAMVLRAKPAVALSEFLPFFMQSDFFMERAKEISVGSLSPTINWKTLAKEEFNLPPLEEQRRIAELLRCSQRLFEAYTVASASCGRVHLAVLGATLRSCQAYPAARLGDLCTRVGVGIASSAAHAYRRSGVPMIRNNNIRPGRLDLDDLLYIDPAFDEANRTKRVRAGDVVTARTGMPGASAVVPPSLDGAQTFTTLVSSPLPGRLDPDYLCLWINGPPGREFIASRKGGGVQKNMNAGLLRELPIRLPPLARQREITGRLQESSKAHELLQAREAETQSILCDLREALVGWGR
jgi:type I restriction enzyme, S subunit